MFFGGGLKEKGGESHLFLEGGSRFLETAIINFRSPL